MNTFQIKLARASPSDCVPKPETAAEGVAVVPDQRLRTFDWQRNMKADRDSGPNFIQCYTRRDAVQDGYHIDVSSVAAEAGIRFPMFLTRSVYEKFVTVPPGVSCQDEAGRLWDIIHSP